MLYEDLRSIHEDIERLEQAIAERLVENPKKDRNRLARDHEIAHFLAKSQDQSQRALNIYNDQQDARMQEVQSISTGDSFVQFYQQLATIKDFHKRNPNEIVENLETAYRRPEKGGPVTGFGKSMDTLFTGQEAFGRYFDLSLLHEEYLNLPGVRGIRRLTYLQFLDTFDQFTPPHCTLTKREKLTDQYFSYVGSLAQYLDSFLRKTKPLEELNTIFTAYDDEFQKEWDDGKVEGWEYKSTTNGLTTQGTGEGIWCADCEKEFKNDNIYRSHLTGKKHIKNAEAKSQSNGQQEVVKAEGIDRLQEKAVAEREHRIRKLANTMKTIRADTRTNVERRFGMTDREREQENAALYAEEDSDVDGEEEDGKEDDDDDKMYNPLKLPLAWDGKPIPFWLYKLHGLGTEYPCEICGNFVYMGRRAYEKHFSEARHLYGLKCLGITSTSLFREITKIAEAELLWNKLQQDKKVGKDTQEDIIEMEDNSGVVMPLKVYEDLAREGML